MTTSLPPSPLALEDWMIEAVAGPVPEALRGVRLPVRVPVTAMTALIDAGLVPDPVQGENEAEVQWVGQVTWRMTARFDVPPALLREPALDLVFEGIDTIATVSLDGVELGRTASMHRPWRFALEPAALRPRDNLLVVELEPAAAWAELQRERLGPLPFIEWPGAGHPYNFVRKMACNFGWDWGPTVVTAGLWRPVRLEARPLFAQVRPLCTAHPQQPDALCLTLHLDPPTTAATDADSLPSTGLVVETTVRSPRGHRVAHDERRCELDARGGLAVELDLGVVERWWPRGYGEPHQHEVALTVRDAVGRTRFAWRGRVGLRTVTLDTTPDAAGRRFVLRVNDVPVFCLGANWIPDDPFLERIDRGRLRTRLEQAASANHNMLRVWGGGIFESDDFYSLCDELGLMVWQDFPFACAMYPEEEPFASLVAEEARDQVARLSRHASLVLWCGCNENLWAHEDWGWPPWREQVAGRTWGRGFYLELLPRIVAELDPTRPYWPGSPWSGDDEVHPLDDLHGTRHIWDAWNDTDYTLYRAYRPRFAAEFGHQAPATVATLRDGAVPLAVDAPGFQWHQKALDGHAKLEARLAEHFEPAVDFVRWVYLTQLNQARAVSLGVEWWRALWPHCAGVLYWQLNDCWPAISWSAVDYGGRRKPLWYAVRRSFAPRLVTIQPGLGVTPPLLPGLAPRHAAPLELWPDAQASLQAVFINDTDLAWSLQPRARRCGLDGQTLAEQTLAAVEVAPRSVLALPLDEALSHARAPGAELIEVRAHPDAAASPHRALWFFARDKDLELAPARLDARVEREETGYRLELEAETLVRDLVLMADLVAPDAEVDEQLLTLLPGERAQLRVRTATTLAEPDALLDALHATTRFA